MRRASKSLLFSLLITLILFSEIPNKNLGLEIGNAVRSTGDFLPNTRIEGVAFNVWFPIIVKESNSLTSTCFDRPGPVITIRDHQSSQFGTVRDPLPENVNVDARTATWT